MLILFQQGCYSNLQLHYIVHCAAKACLLDSYLCCVIYISSYVRCIYIPYVDWEIFTVKNFHHLATQQKLNLRTFPTRKKATQKFPDLQYVHVD